MRGNIVMSSYFDDPEQTAKAFDGGWFHAGDLAVWHPDGMIEVRERGRVRPLPKASTGKVQKYVLREREWTGRDTRVGPA